MAFNMLSNVPDEYARIVVKSLLAEMRPFRARAAYAREIHKTISDIADRSGGRRIEAATAQALDLARDNALAWATRAAAEQKSVEAFVLALTDRTYEQLAEMYPAETER